MAGNRGKARQMKIIGLTTVARWPQHASMLLDEPAGTG
jgi:hypothetical protein